MALLALVTELVELGIELAPTIINGVAAQMQLSGSKDPPTPEQQAAIDTALDAADAALQSAKQGGG